MQYLSFLLLFLADPSGAARNQQGKAFESQGKSIEAVAELKEAIRLEPKNEAFRFDLAQLFLRHQNFDEAIAVLEEASKMFPNSPQMELARGVAYYGQRKFAEAIDSFLRTIRLAPEVPQPYVFLGRILDQAGNRMPEIAKSFASYVKANPNDAMAQFLHGKASSQEAALRKSITLDPNYWESHFELALLLEKKKDLPTAAAELSKAATLSPTNPTPHYRLARIYDRLGKTGEAEAERKLHEELTTAEKAAIENHKAGVKRLKL